MRAFALTVLAALFLVELLAFTAAGVVGYRLFGPLGAVLAVVVVIVAWALFAAPRARYGGRVVTPVVQAAVYLACAAGLAPTGSWGLGVGLLAVAGVLTRLARIPEVRAMHLNPTAPSRRGPTDT